jgi:hypothetical protein
MAGTVTMEQGRRTLGSWRTLWNRLTPTRGMAKVSHTIATIAGEQAVRVMVKPSFLLVEHGSQKSVVLGSQVLAQHLAAAGVAELTLTKGAQPAQIERVLNALMERTPQRATELLDRQSIKIENVPGWVIQARDRSTEPEKVAALIHQHLCKSIPAQYSAEIRDSTTQYVETDEVESCDERHKYFKGSYETVNTKTGGGELIAPARYSARDFYFAAQLLNGHPLKKMVGILRELQKLNPELEDGISPFIDLRDRPVKMPLAQDPTTSPETLLALLNLNDLSIIKDMLINPKITKEVFASLAGHPRLDLFWQELLISRPELPADQFAFVLLKGIRSFEVSYETEVDSGEVEITGSGGGFAYPIFKKAPASRTEYTADSALRALTAIPLDTEKKTNILAALEQLKNDNKYFNIAIGEIIRLLQNR